MEAKRIQFGYRRLAATLVWEGIAVNHKHVYRQYREEGLAMRFGGGGSAGRGAVAKPAANRANEDGFRQ
jgi:putative transposase